jgi:hypothetical protein
MEDQRSMETKLFLQRSTKTKAALLVVLKAASKYLTVGLLGM